MSLDFSKIFGWVLLIAGVGIIFWTLYSSYNIFTGKTPGPEFFKIKEKATPAPTAQKGKAPTPLEGI